MKKYLTEEERKAARREYNKQYYKQYYQNNKEKILEQHAEYRQNNKEKIAEYRQNNKEKIAAYNTEYYSTPKGRASVLLSTYKFNDKKRNRGECTLTAEWIIQNIFTQPCRYCGKTDWHELGCDRKDSSLPHTPDNCVSCCAECNTKKGTTPYEEYLKLVGKSDTD